MEKNASEKWAFHKQLLSSHCLNCLLMFIGHKCSTHGTTEPLQSGRRFLHPFIHRIMTCFRVSETVWAPILRLLKQPVRFKMNTGDWHISATKILLLNKKVCVVRHFLSKEKTRREKKEKELSLASLSKFLLFCSGTFIKPSPVGHMMLLEPRSIQLMLSRHLLSKIQPFRRAFHE